MSDIALLWSNPRITADLGLDGADLTVDDGLETAALISLFCDRRAEDADVLPQGVTDRRGWCLDSTGVDKIGSRLWLLDRSKQTPDVLTRAEEYAREALAWMLEDLVVSKIDVVTEFLKRPLYGLGMRITFHRPKLDPVKFRFNRNWEAQAAIVRP